jgi:hypothetical protein
MVDGAGGTLLHAFREGRAHVPAFLDDYAFLVEGLLQLHGATGDGRWLTAAVRLAEEQEGRLGDAEGGGAFAAGQDPRLLFRSKPAFDGAVASGNGIAALNAVELSRLTGDPVWADRAEGALRAFGEAMSQAPLAHVTLSRALERLLTTPRATPAPPRAAAAIARESSATAPGGASQATAPATATGTLEDEAYEAVEIEARLGTSEDEDWKPFRVEMTVRKGWHVNANPSGPGLVATGVAGVVGRLRNVRYPAGEAWDGGGGPVPVYQGRVTIEGEVERQSSGAGGIEVGYQACDDARCLPPVTRIVRLR